MIPHRMMDALRQLASEMEPYQEITIKRHDRTVYMEVDAETHITTAPDGTVTVVTIKDKEKLTLTEEEAAN